MRQTLAACAMLGLVAGTAQATFLSFASDSDDKSWTWTGKGASMFDAADAFDPITLMIDDHNGPLPAVAMSVEFDAEIHLSYNASVPIGGGFFVHTYHASGFFKFDDFSSGAPVVKVFFEGAIMTAVGGAASWGSTGALLGSDDFTSVTYESHIHMPAYGLFAGATSIGPDDFGFDLSVINHSGLIPYTPHPSTNGVALGSDMLPLVQWWAESSYSGSAVFVPSPSSMALLGLAGLVAVRRRR